VSLTGGEIFMRKDIMEVLDLFRQKGYRCGYLTTNGTILDEARADALADLAVSGFLTHVTVSIDGPGDLHDRARGVKGTFERTAAGLRRLQDAANRKHAPLRVSINTTVTHESLDALDQVVEVAGQLGVDAIGLNHLMFATQEEVDQTVRLTGAASSAAIATFVTADPGIAPDEVRAKVSSLEEKCRQRNIRFDYRPKVKPAILDAYYTPGTPLAGRCLYPFLHARVGFSGKVFFCPFIRIEVGDLTESTLEEVWNSPRYVDLRRRLLERQLFPVCRRCCKVELSPERLPARAPAVAGRRVIRLTAVEGDDTPTPVGTRRHGNPGDRMLGRAVLLINPPLVNGQAFTRQGRCQERAEVLGTTKPPYSLVVIAALLRAKGSDFRLFDQTAERQSTESVIERLDREHFQPSLIVFCSTIPTLDADVVEMAKLKRHFGAPLVSFGPHAACAPAESMQRAPEVDAMIVGEPEDAVLALADLEAIPGAGRVQGLTVRLGDEVMPATGRAAFDGFADMPFPAWDLLRLSHYTLPLVNKPYVLVETSRGCPYSCDFCVVPFVHGHKFRERDAKTLVDEIERCTRDFGLEYFYLFGDTVTLNVKTFGAFCDELIARKLNVKWLANGRADNLVDLAFVQKLRDSGCWMLSIGVESGSDDTRRDMLKKLERPKIRIAFENLRRTGIKSFAFLIYGYPGDTRSSMERTTQYAMDLDADYANFYPAIPYPGTELYEKCRKQGLLATDDWSKMEYSYYVIQGDGLDERVVMDAIARGKRRFFLRPRYIIRHVGDLVRLLIGNRRLAWEVALRIAFGLRDVKPPATGQSRPVSEKSATTP
jgi:radical SAM superfamily enzyme YgiQ (UPF0313 family)/sulfatase maturation enzyme AslB (radical SAM superfamily)